MFKYESNGKNLGENIWQGTWLILPLYPWFSEKTKQVYHRNIFKEMQALGITFNELNKKLDKWIKFRNEIFGRHCDNEEIYLMRENKRFSFFLHENCPEFTLYNDNSEHLGEIKININEPPTNEFIEWIENLTYEYCNKTVHCSDCKKEMKEEEIAGRFYAGIYCKECWEREWTEREAEENYD